jgi:hypothetical protein
MLIGFYEFFGVNASSFLTMIENGGGIYAYNFPFQENDENYFYYWSHND